MSQTTIIKPNYSSETTDLASEISLIDLLAEIKATPKEYWPNLLHIIHSFRAATTLNLSHVSGAIISEKEEQIKKNQAAIELLRFWRETDDDLEQQETWEILRQAFEVNE